MNSDNDTRNLKSIREEKGMSVEDVSSYLNVSINTVIFFEDHTSDLSIRDAATLIELYDININNVSF